MKNFSLNAEPVDYILSVHMNNLNIYLAPMKSTFRGEWEVYQAFGIEAVTNSMKVHIENLILTYGERAINNFINTLVKKTA